MITSRLLFSVNLKHCEYMRPQMAQDTSAALHRIGASAGGLSNTYVLEGRPAVVLVRSVGHIAFRGDADPADRWAAYCRKVFGASSDAASLVTRAGAALVP